MKNQKIAIATVVGTILIFLLDFLYYAVLMDSPGMGECCMKEQPDMMWMIIGDVLLALGFVVLYTKAAGSGSKMSEGINFGLWAAVLLAISMNVMWYSLSTSMTMNMVFMESAYGIVKYCILGIVVAHLVASSSSGDRGKVTGSGESDPTQSPTGGGDRGKTTGSGE